MSSMFPLSIVYHARRRGALKADPKAEHSMRSGVSLTRSERMVHRAADPSLPGEHGAAQAHVVRGVSDAQLGEKQQPVRLLHLGPSARHRPSARRGDSGSPRKVTCVRACSIRGFQEAPSPENTRRS